MSNYFRHVQITLRSAVLAGWLVDAKANTDLRYTIRLLTSDKAMRFYVRTLDTAIWLCKAFYTLCEITIMLGAIAATWIDEQIIASQQPIVPDVNIDIEEVLSEYDAYHKPVLEDTVVPFTRPVPTIESAPIDWKLWGVRDLRSANQRTPFGIPSRDTDGKMFSKAALCDMYTVALAVGAGFSFTWQEEEEAA